MARSRRACPERSRGNPGDACWRMLLRAFPPQTTPEDKKVTNSRTCDFFDLFVFSAYPAVSQGPGRTVILSEALRRSTANKRALWRVAEGTPAMLVGR